MATGVPTLSSSPASSVVPPTNTATPTANAAVQQPAAVVAAGNAALADLQTAMATTVMADFFKANASLTQPPRLSAPKTQGATDPLLQEVQKMLNSPNASAEDLQTIITGLMTKMSDFTLANEANNIKNRSSEMEATQKKRAQQVQDIANNVSSQNNLGFWAKLLNVFSKIGSTLAAVATIALGAALAPFSGGVSIAIIVYGGYSLFVAVTDTAKEIYKAAGGTGWNFSLTLGEAIGGLAQLAGASKDVSNWIKMGVDLAVDLTAAVVLMVIPGGQVKAAQTIKSMSNNLVEIQAATEKLTKFTSTLGRGGMRLSTSANTVTSTTKVAQGGVQISMADKTYDNEKVKAAFASLQLVLDLLQQLQQTSQDFMQSVMDNSAKVFEINASSIKVKAEAQLLMANSGRSNMA